MKKLLTVFFLLFLLHPCISNAQIFFTTYGGVNNDIGNFILEDSLGNFIVTGDTGSTSATWYDSQMLLLKADLNGNILWVKTYGDTIGERARCVRETPDGGYILHGDQDGFWYSGSQSLLIKTNSTGDSLWSTNASGSQGDRLGISVLVLPDSTYIIGSRNDGNMSDNPYQLMKINNIGQHLWPNYSDMCYNLNDFTGASLIQSLDHNYVVAGADFNGSTGNPMLFISKCDSDGVVLWVKYYPGSYVYAGVMLSQSTDGGFVIAGYIKNSAGGNYDMLVMKTDMNGDSLWTKTFGGNGNDILTAVQQTSDGGYVAFGYSNSYSNSYDVVVLRLDANGDSLWQKTYGGLNDEKVTHGIICRDGGFALTGSTKSYGSGGEDVFILRTDSSGNIINHLPELNEQHISIYPNPFNDKLTFSQKNNEPSEIILYDILSRKFFQKKFTNSISINTVQLAKGIYIYEVINKNGINTKGKVVKD